MDTDILIVGAGPTGLALALSLERSGVPFRIIDKASAPGTASRAIAVQARTLEAYDQYGFANEVIESGLKLTKPTIWRHGKRRATIHFGDFGGDISPHPFVLMYPQDKHERLLISHLKQPVERNKTLKTFSQDATGISATLENGEIIRAKYIAGCDGAHSAVRQNLNAGFPGGTYEDLFYVADVDATTIDHTDEFYFFLRDDGFLLVLPLPETNRFRLIGMVPRDVKKETGDITFDDVKPGSLAETPLYIQALHWFSVYHVHHRVTANFRHSRAFLLGDAAHIHSPAGGQGMNTGIMDAFNLGWKLRHALHSNADDILTTYDDERRAFAQKLVATTDRVFKGMTGNGLLSKFMRGFFAPVVMPKLMEWRFFRRFAFKTISQIGVEYRDSPLSEGRVGNITSGDRLPWLGNNYVPLHAHRWQVHVFGTAHPDIVAYCQPKELALMVFPWTQGAQDAGFEMGAVYLVRPDGYVGFAGRETTALRNYCEKWLI